MRNEFTAIIERDGEWFVGWSPEIPGANGQGRTEEECRQNLCRAIQLIREDCSKDELRDVSTTYSGPFGSGPYTPAEAVDRIRELRKGVRLNGLKIKDLINEGRKY